MARVLSFPTNAIGMVYDNTYTVPIDGIWTWQGNYNGLAKIVDVFGVAIDDVLQGYIVDTAYGNAIQNPYNFGGLTPDNTANGYTYPTPGQYGVSTWMPNANKPVITHIIDAASYLWCWKVAKIEDNSTIWLEDPLNTASTLLNTYFYGVSENISAMTKVKIIADDSWGMTLPGQPAQLNLPAGEYTLNANTNGIVEPFVICQNDGNITVTITQ
jgi:hypothetical protein